MQGPAVYSNPSMYFFPDVGDAEGIGSKGAAAIGNGPRTTSGAINYLSRSVPVTGSKGYFKQDFGDENYLRNHFYYGIQWALYRMCLKHIKLYTMGTKI